MAYQKCLDEIRSATGLHDMTDEEAESFLDAVLSTKERIMRERALGSGEALAAAAKELAEQQRAVAARARFNALQDFQKRVSRRARIMSDGPAGVVDGVRAELHGVNTPRSATGWRFGAEQEWHALSRDLQARGVTAELDRAGLYKAARTGQLDDKIAAEMWELSRGTDGEPGVSGSKEAQKIADIYNRFMTVARQRLNDAGAWVGDAANYVAHTSHDMDAIRKAGREAWLGDVAPLLDPKTFEGVKDPLQFLSHVYDSLSTGVHLTPDGMVGFKGPAFQGPGSMAKRLSQSRVLLWKDAPSWMAYQKKYGEPNLGAAVLHSLDQSARATALLSRYGTNPENEFARDIAWLKETLLHTDPGAIDRVKSWEGALQRRFDLLSGKSNIPENRLIARIGALVRLDEALSKLGNVAFTHLSVGMTRAAEMWHHGVNPLESYANFVSSAIRGRGQGETRELMNLLGAGADGATERLVSRFDLDNGIPGVASSLASTFIRMTGLRYLYDSEKGGMEFMLAHNLGRNIDTPFAELHPGLQKLLGGYGIAEREWDLLRGAAERTTLNSRVFMTPKDATRISDTAAKGYLGTDATPHAIAGLRQRLAVALDGYLNDSAGRGMIQPGIETRAILLQGTRPGSVAGEVARSLALFKIWPTELIRAGLGREIYTSSNWKGAAIGITHMAAAGMAFGYLRMLAADLAGGKVPRDPSNPKTLMAALAQGGGFGLMGDFLFGEQSRFGEGPLTSLAGPVAGDASSVMDMLLKLRDAAIEGKPAKSVLPEAVKFVSSHVPFANLFYVKAALDYLLLWRLNEWARPGWAARYERTIQKENGQRFWLSPASAVH